MAKTVNRRLRVLRAERDWTQDDLAKRAQITVWRINRIELGYLAPTPAERLRLTRALGTPELGL